jgi:MoxR-like ATPase
MEPPWYRGTGEPLEASPELPLPVAERFTNPMDYLADDGLVDAVNVALHLGQPLLLTGQPGTGKTQLASSLALELRCGEPLKFETKSTSVARDLFYIYDTLARFRAPRTIPGRTFIHWNALGLAILYANPPERVRHLLDPEQVHPARRRSVVLIDEIDKAPRDFPNDLLNEIEHLYFRIPELSNETVKADKDMRPVLVLTSNSEKNLPEAFLRRCVFYYIPFPERKPKPQEGLPSGTSEAPPRRVYLEDVVRRRLGAALPDDGLLQLALDLLDSLRDPTLGLLKTPSTGELLAWMLDLSQRRVEGNHLVERTLCALIKTVEDRGRAKSVVEAWVKKLQKKH